MAWLCGAVVAVVGVLLAVGGGYLGFVTLPVVVNQQIEEGVVLHNDTIQMERFLVTPVPLHFKVYIFNVTNSDAVNAGGSIPQVQEIGPYVYTQWRRKEVLAIDNETITYREYSQFEFDVEESFPLTEDDELQVVNVPYHAILQGAEVESPNMMLALSLMLNQIFGAANNRPVFPTRVRDLLFDGILMCVSPNALGRIACEQIRASVVSSENMRIFEDGSFSFSFFYHKDNFPTGSITVDRGLVNSYNLGEILRFEGSPHVSVWPNDTEGEDLSVCNMINGTDSGIFRPFVNRSEPLMAFNPDICRSVELRYQYDTEYEGIPAVRFATGDWLLSGDDSCFCLSETAGVTLDDGCLYPGAMELFSCTGAHLVFSYPHFLYADLRYRNGLVGLRPQPDLHQIFIELEPSSGTILRGLKRAQFNLFLRPIASITGTSNLHPTLMPILWVEEGMNLPEEFVNEVKDTLLRPVRLIAILRAVAIAVGGAIAVLGVWLVARPRCAGGGGGVGAAATPANGATAQPAHEINKGKVAEQSTTTSVESPLGT